MNFLGEIQAVEGAGHVDVGEQHAHARVFREQLQGRLAVLGLENLEAAILQHVGGYEAQNGFIVDDEHDSRGGVSFGMATNDDGSQRLRSESAPFGIPGVWVTCRRF